jgi:type IV secretion system protein VirD4
LFCTTLIAMIALAGAVLAFRYVGRDKNAGMLKRKRLGVDTMARLAKPKELAPMIVPGPTAGRFLLGKVGRFLVATENRQAQLADPQSSAPLGLSKLLNKDAESRRGDRSAVAVLGPTRCGKTANVISGILDWDGPAILSSVKSDLLDSTVRWRRNMGEVRVFDPTASTNEHSAQWSPLRAADTMVGAQKAARALCDASPKGGVEQADFWASLSERLLWPMLWTAAVSGRTMSDVVRWVLTEDKPTDEQNLGEIGSILKNEMRSTDSKRRTEAEKAWTQMVAVWGRDPRTRSSIYATAETVIAAWSDPGVAETSIEQEIDLDWLMGGEGPRTLYLCAPAHEQQRLSAVFGGLLGDLFQQAYEKAGREGQLAKPLLIVMDEAGNTPCKWLPGYASTCAGIGIQLITVWQSKSQIDHAYGKLGDSVLTNHGTKIFYSGISDPSTLKYAAELLGEEEVLTRSFTESGSGGSKSMNESTTRASLVPADILRQVAPGQALLLHGTLRPAHLHSRPYFADKRLSMKAKGIAPIVKGRKVTAVPTSAAGGSGSPITIGTSAPAAAVWGRRLRGTQVETAGSSPQGFAAGSTTTGFGVADPYAAPDASSLYNGFDSNDDPFARLDREEIVDPFTASSYSAQPQAAVPDHAVNPGRNPYDASGTHNPDDPFFASDPMAANAYPPFTDERRDAREAKRGAERARRAHSTVGQFDEADAVTHVDAAVADFVDASDFPIADPFARTVTSIDNSPNAATGANPFESARAASKPKNPHSPVDGRKSDDDRPYGNLFGRR